MIVRVSKIMLEVLGALLAGVAIIAGFIAYRLAYEGPIHLSFLKPYVEEALNRPEADFQFVIQDTVLAWAGWERTLDIRGVGVQIKDSTGQDLASVPEIGFGLSGTALFRGLVAPSRIELFRPDLTLVRNEDGDFQFGAKLISGTEGTGAATTTSQSGLVSALVRELLEAPDPGKRTGYLTEAAIYSGTISIDDRHAGNVWKAENVEINLARGDRGLAGSFRVNVPQFGDPARLSGNVFLPSGGDRFEIDARLQRFAAPSIGLIETGLAILANANVFLEGEAQTTISMTGKVGLTEFSLTGSDGELALPEIMKAPLPIKTLAAKGRVDPDQDLIVLDRLALDIDGPTFELSGQGDGFLSGRATDDGAPVLTATLNGTGIDWQKVDGWWPETVASDARGWLIPNITTGIVEDLEAKTKIRFPQGEKPSAAVEELGGTFKAHDLTVHYLRPMPPIEHGVATASFDATKFTAKIQGGGVGQIKLGQGDLLITGLDQEDQFISVGGNITSPMKDALALLDHKRLGYTSKLGLKPENASGDAATHIQFDFPAEKDLTFAQVKIGVSATMSNVGLKKAMFEQNVTDGNLELALTQNGMRISGPLKFGGIPLDLQWLENFYDGAPFDQQIRAVGTVNAEQRAAFGYDTRPFFDGPSLTDLTYISYPDGRGRIDVTFDLTQSALAFDFAKWSKPAGEPGRGKLAVEMRDKRIRSIPLFDVTAGNLKTAGKIDFDQSGTPTKVAMPSLKYGRNALSNVGVAFKGDLIEVGIGGGDVDVEPWMDNDEPPKDDATLAREENEPQRPFRLAAPSLNSVRIGEGRVLQNVKVELYHDPMWWDVIDVSATLPGGAPMTLVYRPGEPGSGKHHLSAETTDAGAALRALDIYDSIKGGTLKITGEVKDDEPRRPLRGRMESSSFRLLNTPFFVRFLSVAALTGLIDVLSGEGFYFDGASARFTKTMGTIEVRKFRSAGPSIGLTSNGKIDLDRQKIDLEGVIVPAYAINSILGNIPILGNILQGGPGEGLFSASYKIIGDLPEPKIDVNPWTALAPGFLRDIFTGDIDAGQGGAAPPKPPTGSHK
ncbi:YhdP family protein [Dongia deserti]|uniref:YhdP family protein n=1 Tax=Dongia deserti TaxID=2268030 RepID=UPI000E646A78|nr:AsmA-like C-terminal domain-containing protein [Dongia deserti]